MQTNLCILDHIETREAFRAWLEEHHASEKECYLKLVRGRPRADGRFYYLDAVEEALCFGWIDSTHRVIDGVRLQRFSPRAKRSHWTELNRARVRRLEATGRMTDAGRAVLPREEYEPPEKLLGELREAGVYEAFLGFPELYRRIRLYNLDFTMRRDPEAGRRALRRLIRETKAGRTYGEWNDYGRLTEPYEKPDGAPSQIGNKK